MAAQDADTNIPDTLYHTLLTVVDYEADATGSVRTVYPLGTHTALSSAKAFSAQALPLLGYARDEFEAYEEKPAKTADDDDDAASPAWRHGDGVLVYARRTGPHAFLVSLLATPNNERLPAADDGHAHVRLPDDAKHLHYVLQTKVDYNVDRSGEVQTTDVEGVYVRWADALAAARRALVSDEVPRADYAQYDEWPADQTPDDWPFGDDVVVHAVAQTGENYRVAVRHVPGTHAKHGKVAQK